MPTATHDVVPPPPLSPDPGVLEGHAGAAKDMCVSLLLVFFCDITLDSVSHTSSVYTKSKRLVVGQVEQDAKDNVRRYGTTTRPKVERTADNLRMGTGSIGLCEFNIDHHHGSIPSASSAPHFSFARAQCSLNRPARC